MDLEARDAALDETCAELLRETEAQLEARGRASIDRRQGLSSLCLVRWMVRRWSDREDSWGALVHLEPRFLPPEPAPLLADALAQARGGWLFCSAGWRERFELRSLAAEARKAGARLLLESGRLGPPLPAAAIRRLRHLDGFHLVASDPSLRNLRRAVLAYCRAQGILHLHGQPGTGRRSLARWAHALLDDRNLETLGAGESSMPAEGRWQLVEQLSELEPTQLAPLRGQIRRREQRYPRFTVHEQDNAPDRPRHPALEPLVGSSPALSQLLTRTERFARSPLPMLVLGETGTGKELIARAIHELSGRRGRYVVIDLNTRNETFVESALFGHVRGAFTGAAKARSGAAVEADGGTLFLDEIGNLSPRSQAKLLRLLEAREVQPLGSDSCQSVDVRIVAATNVDLEELVRTGDFRGDLYYRFNPSATLRVPALRERPGDIPELSRHFLQKMFPERSPDLSEDALRRLSSWPWRGNVRELRHIVEAAAVESEGQRIEVAHLGSLAQATCREAPLIVVSSESPEERQRNWGLTRSEIQALTAVTLELPPLGDRGPLAIRNAVLGLLAGRPIRSRALAVLERRSWWGNYTELVSDMAAIRGSINGPVDIPELEQRLPNLLDGLDRAPLRMVLFPSIHNGHLVGLEREFSERGILIGRTSQLSELRPRAGDRRLEQRWQAIESLAGSASLGLLNLSFLGRLSRAHLLLLRDAGGMVVHKLPGAPLRVLAGPLDANSELFEVKTGNAVEIGTAGEIQVVDEQREQPYLRLLAFTGAAAGALEPGSLERFAAEPAERTLGVPQRRKQVWGLRDFEVQALAETLVRALTEPGSLASQLRGAAREWLESAPQPGRLSRQLPPHPVVLAAVRPRRERGLAGSPARTPGGLGERSGSLAQAARRYPAFGRARGLSREALAPPRQARALRYTGTGRQARA